MGLHPQGQNRSETVFGFLAHQPTQASCLLTSKKERPSAPTLDAESTKHARLLTKFAHIVNLPDMILGAIQVPCTISQGRNIPLRLMFMPIIHGQDRVRFVPCVDLGSFWEGEW